MRTFETHPKVVPWSIEIVVMWARTFKFIVKTYVLIFNLILFLDHPIVHGAHQGLWDFEVLGSSNLCVGHPPF